MEKKMPNKFPENELINIIKQTCEGLKFLHEMSPPIAHRDIKIENILINENVYKLCDFGSSSTEIIDFS